MAKKPSKRHQKSFKYEGILDKETGLITWKSNGNVTTLSTDPPPPPPVTPGPRGNEN